MSMSYVCVLTTTENTITYHNTLCCSLQNFAQALFSVSLGATTRKRKKIIGQATFWHEVKVVCCLPTPFYTPKCSRSHKGLAPHKVLLREIWERFQLTDISTVWQQKSNYLKRAKSGWKRVIKEMITGSPSFFLFPTLPTFREPGTCHDNLSILNWKLLCDLIMTLLPLGGILPAFQ